MTRLEHVKESGPRTRRARYALGACVLLLVLVTLAVARPAGAGLFDRYQRDKIRTLRHLIALKTGDRKLARTLAKQFKNERKAIVQAFQQNQPLAQIQQLVQNGTILPVGSVLTALQPGVHWVLLDSCEITTETFLADLNETSVGLVGIGQQDLVKSTANPEKRLDLAVVQLPAGREVTISSDSFSPLVKGIVIVGGIAIFSAGCGPAAPSKAACANTPTGGCVSPNLACGGTCTCQPTARGCRCI